MDVEWISGLCFPPKVHLQRSKFINITFHEVCPTRVNKSLLGPLGRAFSTGSWGKGSEYHTTPPLKDLPAERVYLIYTVDVFLYARIYFSEKKSHHSVTEVKNHDGDRRVTKYKKEKTECLRKHWLEACPSLAYAHWKDFQLYQMLALSGPSGNINFLLIPTERGKILFRKSLINFSVLITILVKCIIIITGYSKVFGEKSSGVFVSLISSKSTYHKLLEEK